MTKTIVRRARSGDEKGIHDAHMKSIQEVCRADYNSEQINAWGEREYSYEVKNNLISNQYVWVVERENIIEGYGLLFINKEKELAEVRGLYLTPIVIGMGFGKSVLDSIKLIVRELGYQSIYLESTITSKSFYEKQGAIQYKEDIKTSIGGVPIECHPMKIELAKS